MSDEESPSSTLREDGNEDGEGFSPLKPHLFIVMEADRPAAGGARYALEGIDEVIVGRGDERGAVRETSGGRRRLVVRVPSQRMSAKHARILRDGSAWSVEDLGSKNGTFVAGTRLTEARLGKEDWLEAGRTLFMLRSAIPTPPGTDDDDDARTMTAEPPWRRSLLPEVRQRLDKLERVAASAVPVLLLGESGTGKELVARGVHAASKRAGAFVPVNCGAIPTTLVESLLFGHVRGAFSGAVRDEPGLVRTAHTGTLFLDEIADLPSPAQASLLRVLQEGEVLAVGSTSTRHVDFRVVCATHRPLDALVAESAFRSDLLARIDGFRHAIPPLRRRREDLGLLVAELLLKLAPAHADRMAFSPAAARAIVSHAWPGNVRELEQALGRAIALSPDGQIEPAALRIARTPGGKSERPSLDAEDARLRERLVEALARHRGNVSEVARTMGKARMQVQRWMRRFDLDREAFAAERPPESDEPPGD